MKLISFEIENFRSLKSTKCHLAESLTVLAGKNESGKTSILNALQSLNDESEFTDSDKPINATDDGISRIIYNFEITAREQNEIVKDYVVDLSKVKKEINISIIPKEDEYHISGPFYDDVLNQIETWTNSEKYEILFHYNDAMDLILSKNLEPLNIDFRESDIAQIIKTLDDYLGNLERNPQTNQQIHPDVHNSVTILKSLFNEHEGKEDKITTRIWDTRPKVVLFSSFDDLLPDSVPYGEFINDITLKNKYSIVHDLITLAKLDVKKLNNKDRQLRENLTAKASKIATKKFQNFWEQNAIDFKFSIDEPTVSIFIKDRKQEGYFKPEQRSKGLQWFLSFYLRLEAQSNLENNLILIDEPGLYLHAKAQQNVLAVLEELSKKNQIIYTTHSPYLIDPDNLQRVRLVVKDDKTNKTTVTGSFYNGGDADTLTPIITAIGLDLQRELLFSKDLNIVMEGVSDYYYSRAMLEFIRNSDKEFYFPNTISFIPCMGHTTIGLIVSLLMGLDFKFKVMLDRKDTAKTLNKLKNHGLPDNQFLLVGKNDNDSIEELFSNEEQKKYQITEQNKGKALISRIFYEKVKSGDYNKFSSTTIKNFKALFNEIKNDMPSMEELENEISKFEDLTSDVTELLSMTQSIPMSPVDRIKLVRKYSNKIKSLTKPTLEQKRKLIGQLLQE